jgi:hypothetical protein
MNSMKYISVYETIIKYYPIGLDEFEPIYQEYSGFRLLQQLCLNKLEDKMYKKWKSLIDSVKKEYPELIVVSRESTLLDHSYTATFGLLREEKGTITYFREIYLNLSVIGPYYHIYGSDRVSINNPGHQLFFSQPILTISPIDIYEPLLPMLRKKIEDNFSDYKFVPFYLLIKRPKSLSVAGANVGDGQDASIFQALFTSENITSYQYRGDVSYE